MEDEGMKTKQAVNPYLPSWEYVPDAEPHIVDGRVYIYGSHDLFNGLNFCLGDYVCWSAPVDDLSDWHFEGEIYNRKQHPYREERMLLFAPDVVKGADGRFYLYYFMGGTKMISVAVCDKPAGKNEFYGYVKYADGTPIGKKEEPLQFDPGVFMDDDGKLYLYTGFALQGNPLLLDGSKPTEHGAMCFELDPADMLTVKMGPKYIGIASEKEAPGSSYEGHPFLEASSMRKFNGTYYFIYSSLNSHELCYATSNNPTGGFEFGGVLVSNGDIGLPGITDVKNARNCTGNTHGSLIEINGSYYVFYHRHSNRKQSSRQACAERIRFENGKFYQAEMTSCGLNGGPLCGKGTYEARIACNLWAEGHSTDRVDGANVKKRLTAHPYFTQTGADRESDGDQYIANMRHGATAGFKYFAFDGSECTISLTGTGTGAFEVSDGEKQIAVVPVNGQTGMKIEAGIKPLYFTYIGNDTASFVSFSIA